MNKYLSEIERAYDVVGGVDGVYDDPLNSEMLIVKNGNSVSIIPKAFRDAILSNADKFCEQLSNSIESNMVVVRHRITKSPDPYYLRFNKKKF